MNLPTGFGVFNDFNASFKLTIVSYFPYDVNMTFNIKDVFF